VTLCSNAIGAFVHSGPLRQSHFDHVRQLILQSRISSWPDTQSVNCFVCRVYRERRPTSIANLQAPTCTVPAQDGVRANSAPPNWAYGWELPW
jgi:hypothetical protein